MPLFKRSRTAEAEGRTEGPDVSLLEIQKAFDGRAQQRQAEHVRVIYSMGETTGEVRASITWEALALLRREMARAGKSISERGVLDFVLPPWMIEQLKRSYRTACSLRNEVATYSGYHDWVRSPSRSLRA
jgi:hypothetical protein